MRRFSPFRVSRRRRRGATLIEYALTASMYFTFLFATVEFSWIMAYRNALANGCSRAARLGAVGAPLDDMRDAVRAGSAIDVPDADIEIEQCSDITMDPANGDNWSAVADDYDTGNPPLANDVDSNTPIRVKVVDYQYRMLTGSFLDWLPNVSGGYMPLSASAISWRE